MAKKPVPIIPPKAGSTFCIPAARPPVIPITVGSDGEIVQEE